MKVISVVGYKKTGKTTVVERLAKELGRHGSVATMKHTNEEIVPLTGDTERHLDSGARSVIAITPTRSVQVTRDISLEKGLRRLADDGYDYAVVEGFKNSGLPKLALGDVEAPNIVARITMDTSAEELARHALAAPDYFTLESLVRKARMSPGYKNAGAIGTFTGVVREASNGETTMALEFESFEDAARKRLDAIAEDLKKREGVIEVLIHHNTGRIEAGEDIVFIVVLAGHREELFWALREAIERLKAEVPIWKKELTDSGEYWVHDKG